MAEPGSAANGKMDPTYSSLENDAKISDRNDNFCEHDRVWDECHFPVKANRALKRCSERFRFLSALGITHAAESAELEKCRVHCICSQE